MFPSPEKFDPIYAAAIASFSALVSAIVTTWISGSHARKRQDRDLDHSAKQKEFERLHSLRREVYLPFCDAAAAAIAFVPTIPNCPAEQMRALQPVMELGRHFARVNLIAPPSVIEPSTRAFYHLQVIITTLLSKRLEIDAVASELNLKEEASRTMIERLRGINEQTQELIGSELHKARFDSLQVEFHSLNSKVNEGIAISEMLNQKKFTLEMASQRLAMVMLGPIRKHSIEAFLAIRREIGLPLDDEWVKNFSEQAGKESFALLAKFQDEIERTFAGKEK